MTQYDAHRCLQSELQAWTLEEGAKASQLNAALEARSSQWSSVQASRLLDVVQKERLERAKLDPSCVQRPRRPVWTTSEFGVQKNGVMFRLAVLVQEGLKM